MKLALITRRYPPLIGGAEKVLSYLAPALAAEGHDVTVLTSRFDSSLPKREVVPVPRGSCEIVRLPTSKLRFVGTWLYMRSLARWLRHNKPDLAYVSMLKHDAYVAVGVGKRRGFPVVLRPEGAGATGDLAWQKWGRGGRAISQRCKQARAFVAISKAVHEELLHEAYDPGKIVDLSNGVPVPSSPWNRRPIWREAPRAVFVGRLAVEKDLPTLVRAWAIVRSGLPTAVLTLVGDGPERGPLTGLIAELGLIGAVEMTGAMSDPAPVLRDSDLFVLPSREEGMSIALLEAMVLGLPVVATAIPGNRKLIADFKHGRLVPPGDVDFLAQTIRDQWSNFDRAIHMGRAARSLVEQKYSITIMARRHLELFERLVRSVKANEVG